jgi:hypothetical protein
MDHHQVMKSLTITIGRSRSLRVAGRPFSPLEASLVTRSSMLAKRDQARSTRLYWEAIQGGRTPKRRREE